MLKIYRSINNKIEVVENIEGHSWINLSAPEHNDLEKLSNDYQIPLDFLTDSLDLDERSRVETEEDTVLVVLRIPINNEDEDVPFSTIPVGIILKGDIIITVCRKDITEILDLCSGKIKHFTTNNQKSFVLQMLYRASYYFLKSLKEINTRTNDIETELQKSTKNEELIRLLNIEKSLVFFTTSLRSNELMMERLIRIRGMNFNDDDLDFLEDVRIDHKQAIDVAEIYSNILSGMMDAFASVISNNLNIVMKFLTGTTLLLMIPTLIASVYGMNITLPIQKSPYAFTITMGSSLLLSIAGIILFLKKKWL